MYLLEELCCTFAGEGVSAATKSGTRGNREKGRLLLECLLEEEIRGKVISEIFEFLTPQFPPKTKDNG